MLCYGPVCKLGARGIRSRSNVWRTGGSRRHDKEIVLALMGLSGCGRACFTSHGFR